jgi:hypothetical protein
MWPRLGSKAGAFVEVGEKPFSPLIVAQVYIFAWAKTTLKSSAGLAERVL